MAVVTWPPTSAPTHTSFVEAADKKWKRAQGGKGLEGDEESSQQSSTKEARIGRGQQNKTLIGTAKDRGD